MQKQELRETLLTWRECSKLSFVMLYAIRYHLYNFKNAKKTYGGVLLSVKLLLVKLFQTLQSPLGSLQSPPGIL